MVGTGERLNIDKVNKSGVLKEKKKVKLVTFKLKPGESADLIKFDPRIMDLLSKGTDGEQTEEVLESYGMTKLSRRTIIDTGANVHATGEEGSINDRNKNCNIMVEGSTGQQNAEAVGISKSFGGPIVQIKGLEFDIASFSQMTKRYHATFWNKKNLFVMKKYNSSEYFVFRKHNGLYTTNWRYDSNRITISTVVDSYPDRVLDLEPDDLEERWRSRVSAKERIGSSAEGENWLQNEQCVKANCLTADMEYARRQLDQQEVNEQLMTELELLRKVHLSTGHPGEAAMRKLVEHLNAKVRANKNAKRQRRSFREEIRPRSLKAYFRIFGNCTTCSRAKMTASENHWRSSYKPKGIGDVIHIDWTFYNKKQKKCFLTTIDDHSNYASIVHANGKTANNARLAMIVIQRQYKQNKHEVNHIHCDRDAAFSDKTFGDNQIFVSRQSSGAHDSKVERFTRTLQDKALALKLDLPYDLPDFMQNKLMKWACDAHNMIPAGEEEKSPYEKFHGGRQYSLDHTLYTFGEIVIARNPNVKRKSDELGQIGIIIGRDLDSDDAFEFFCLSSETISFRTKFDRVGSEIDQVIEKINQLDHKETFELSNLNEKEGYEETAKAREFAQINAESPNTPDIDPREINHTDPDIEWLVEDVLYYYYKKAKKRNSPPEKWYKVKWTGFKIIEDNADMVESQLLKIGYTRSELRAFPSQEMYEKTVAVNVTDALGAKERERAEIPFDTMSNQDFFMSEMLLEKDLMTDNMSIRQALKMHPKMARDAILLELKTILEFNTWTYVKKSEISEEEMKKVLISFMFLKNKFGKNNLLEKIKARLVAGGHMQDRASIDPESVSSTTLRTPSYNTLLNIGVFEDAEISIIDIRSAYLQASLPPELTIHMKLNKDIVEILKEIDPSVVEFITETGEVFVKLNKALYGLVQSAKIWYNRLTEALGEIGYYPLPNNIDPNVFKKRMPPDETHQTEWFSIIGVHVDDLGIISSLRETEAIHKHLTKEFGEVKYQTGDELDWLGIHITRDRNARSIKLSQKDYVERMLEKFKTILKVKSFEDEKNPAPLNLFAYSDEFKVGELDLEFLSIVMSIAFLAHRTRPDLLTTVSYLTTRSLYKDPNDRRILLKLIGYIQHTQSKGLRLSPTSLDIYAWTDASYGNHPEKKGHSGIVVSLSFDRKTNKANGFVYASSKKQKIVAQSSAEAELMAQSEGLKYLLWLKFLLEELGHLKTNPMIIFLQDNNAAILMSKAGCGVFKNTKHISHRFFLIQTHIEEDNIVMEHCPTELMIADVLTKAMGGGKLIEMTNFLLNEEENIDIDKLIAKTNKAKKVEIEIIE